VVTDPGANGSAVSAHVAGEVDTCPRCQSRRIAIGELDLDAGTSVRACADCGFTFGTAF
jgi:hypothetical protein